MALAATWARDRRRARSDSSRVSSDVAEGGATGLPLEVTMKSLYSIVNRVRKARYWSTVTVVRAPTDWPLAPGARVINVNLYWPGSTFLKDRLKATFTAPSSKGST